MLASAGSIVLVFAGAVLFGLHLALTQGLLAALVADLAPADLRGTAFGVFHLVSGIAMVGTLTAGFLWDVWSSSAMFWIAAAVTVAGILALLPFANGQTSCQAGLNGIGGELP